MSARRRRYTDRLQSQPRVEVFPRADRLESWKEIAAYLNRSERTVRRWEEKEGLPVHRLQHDRRASVYAYTAELDTWRESRRQLLAAEPPEVTPAPSTPSRGVRRGVVAGIVATIVAAAALVAFVMFDRSLTTEPRAPNPEAVRAWQSGLFSMNAGRVQVQTGIRYYEEAIRLDPSFADAWASLATAHTAETWFGDRAATDTMAQARREAQRALELNPSLEKPWNVFANASHYLDWDHARAEEQYRKALAMKPGNSHTLHWFSEFLLDMRRFNEALETSRQAQNANPRWLEPITVAGNIQLFSGHLDLAISEYKRALALEPNFGLANHFLGRAYLSKGQPHDAIAQLRKSNELLGHLPFSMGDLGYALAVTGARDEATRMMADLIARREQGYYPAFPVAAIQLGLGNTASALEWLERAADERHMGYYLPSVDPMYDSLRAHPRFQRLIARMNLAGQL